MNLKNALADLPRGFASGFCKRNNIRLSNFSAYKSGMKKMPPWICARLEYETDGKITRKMCRPDDYAKHWPEIQ